MSLLINAIGTGAALCSMTSFAPQIFKIWRDRDASSVSMRMYVVTVTGFALWIAYGVLLKSWPLTVSNVICLTMSAAVLVLRLKFGSEAPRHRAEPGSPG